MLTVNIIHMLVNIIRALFVCLAGHIKQPIHTGLLRYQQKPEVFVNYAHLDCICSLMPHVNWKLHEGHVLVDCFLDLLEDRLNKFWAANPPDSKEKFRFSFFQCFMYC